MVSLLCCVPVDGLLKIERLINLCRSILSFRTDQLHITRQSARQDKAHKVVRSDEC